MMKKICMMGLVFLLTLAMLCGMMACQPGGADQSETTGTVTDGATTVGKETHPTTDAATDAATDAVTDAVTDPVTEDEAVTDPETEPETETEAEDPSLENFTYKYVVVVGVDGAGAFFKDADKPKMDKIFANGAVTYEAITSTPSISAQSWGSLLHGVTPEFHGLDNGTASSRAYPADSEFPSVFRVIREQMPEANLASFCNWNPINFGIIEENIGVYKDSYPSDIKVIREASAYVKDTVTNGGSAPALLFLQLDEADASGHGHGYGSASHLKKIKQQDGWISYLYETYEELGLLEDTLFIVTADHGGNGNDHGGSTDAEMQIMFAAAGMTVEKGTIGEMGIRDTASIILHALGLEQPATWTSRVPSGLFRGVVAGDRPVYEIDGSEREHENQPTPEVGSAGHVSNFITDKELLHYLTFDGDVTDEMGAATTQNDKLYFVEGYFGEAASLVDGYVSLPNYAPGTGSFSVSLWVNTNGVTSDPPLFSNKNWNNGNLSVFVFCLKPGAIQFNAGDGSNRMDMSEQLPLNYTTGWMHLTLVVDREAGEVRISIDFGAFRTMAIPEALKNASFDAYDVLNIGQDGTGSYGAALSATVDEFMIFDGALTDADLAKLAEYYGK